MNETICSIQINSPVGKLQLEVVGNKLTGIRFMLPDDEASIPAREPSISPLLEKAKKQLGEYFNGDRKTFSLPLKPAGTDFELSVWEELKRIPYGISITYKELAHRLGDENKIRAVGRANGKNPLPIIIPCHRVVGKDNKLTGYVGGIECKRWLLRHEGVLLL
jgi:methylated-DNA-[protein]-cysteine S-methyltransferase